LRGAPRRIDFSQIWTGRLFADHLGSRADLSRKGVGPNFEKFPGTTLSPRNFGYANETTQLHAARFRWRQRRPTLL
jgi:hypothetical protein